MKNTLYPIRFEIRMNAYQYKKVEQLSHKCHKTISQYIRDLIDIEEECYDKNNYTRKSDKQR